MMMMMMKRRYTTDSRNVGELHRKQDQALHNLDKSREEEEEEEEEDAVFLVGHPTRQPAGKAGSSSGGRGTCPHDHWHSCVSKLGSTVRGKPRESTKNCCAGNLHWCRQRPLQFDSCKNLHFSTTMPPTCPSTRKLAREGPTRKLRKTGVTREVRSGA